MMRKRRRFWVTLCCGFGAGMATAWGLVEMAGREGWRFGGEVLVLPLMAGLVYLGYMARDFVEEVRR